MQRTPARFTYTLLGLLTLAPIGQATAAETARGIVFEDRNGNRIREAGEPGIPGVAVSNQRDVVRTDSQGHYALPVTEDTILFVTKPTGFSVPRDQNNLPRFYYIHKPEGSPRSFHAGVPPTGPLPDSIDFALTRQPEPAAFRMIAFADPQPESSQEVDYIRDDVLNELMGTRAAFGVTLGDIVSDHLWLYGRYNDFVGRLGIPFYNIFGNHDSNYDAETDENSDETFHRVFGPTYYSWDYAQIHFIALDNIIWLGPGKGTGNYQEAITPGQLAWLANDIKHVPETSLIVLLMHSPLFTAREDKPIPGTQALFTILENRPKVLALAGHTHLQEHVFFGPEHGWKGKGAFHHVICATVSGSWWSGPKDARGIPVADQREGTPNGYVLVDFDGTDYVTTFKPASLDPRFRMRIYPPGRTGPDGKARTKLLVNVFEGSERCTVEYSLDGGRFAPMTFRPQLDPLSQRMFSGPIDTGKPWVRPTLCPHMWEAFLPRPLARGTHAVTVRVHDHYERTYEQSRIFVPK
jgi:hypothetical protein